MEKKRYFKINLRIASNEGVNYVSDGKISILNNEIQGYATFDYITGIYKKRFLQIELCKYDPEFGISYNMYKNNSIDDFTLPGKFYLMNVNEEEEVIELEVTEKFNEKINIFESNLVEAKEKCGFL